MSQRISDSKVRKSSFIPLLLAVFIPTLAIAAALWVILVRNPIQANALRNSELMENVVGLANPVKNVLAPTFTDTDGDLVADPPADPAKLIDPPKLFFSYVASDNAAEYKKSWSGFVDYLSKVTGKPVEYVMYANTDDELRAFRDGKLHVAGLNTGSLPVAVNLAGFVPVAQLGGPNGATVVRAEFIVPANSPITDLKSLTGHTLTLTEPNSNSGYKAPILLMKDHGMNLITDYNILTSGGYQESLQGIAEGKYEAAAVASDMLDRAESQGVLNKKQYRIVYSSENFPAAGLGYAYNLKPELAAKVKDAILSFKFAGSTLEKEFAASGQDRFIPVNYKDDWKLIRRIDNEIGRQQQIKDPEPDPDVKEAATQPTTAPTT